jgi:hypothetical protein
MGEVVDLSDRRTADIGEQLRQLSAGVSELVWPVLLRLPVESRTIDLITGLLDLELAAERLASEHGFMFLEAAGNG